MTNICQKKQAEVFQQSFQLLANKRQANFAELLVAYIFHYNTEMQKMKKQIFSLSNFQYLNARLLLTAYVLMIWVKLLSSLEVIKNDKKTF